MSEWQPIETAPEGQWIITYAEWADPQVAVCKFSTVTEMISEVVSESTNRIGRRVIFQEHEITKREWTGDHWEPTHWMPLPEPPKP